MKYILSTLLGLILSLGAIAQTNPGVDYIVLGEFELAKNYFMKTLRQSPADSYYHLGQIALEEGNIAEAKSNFEKGLAGNPESPLNAIGLAKLKLKDSPKEAKSELSDIRKNNRKNVEVLLEIAKGYYENDMVAEGKKMIEEVKKTDKNSPLPYMLEGYILQKSDLGAAATCYEQALLKDDTNLLAYMKGAQVYMDVNPDASKEKLKKVIALDPSNVLANKYMAQLNYKVAQKTGKYDGVLEAFDKYFASGQYTISDTRDYAASQFFVKDYKGALTTIEKGLLQDPKHFVLNRLNMYCKNELKDYDGGLIAGEAFFATPKPNDTVNYIVQDHVTYANLLAKTENIEASLKEFDKAAQLDPTNASVLKDISQSLAEVRMYEEAGDYFVKFIAAQAASDDATQVVQPTDYYQSSSFYLRAAGKAERDSAGVEAVHKLLDKADVEIVKLIEMTPDVPLGYRTRAQINSRKDPDSTNGTAKPHFEALIAVVNKEIAEPKEDADGNPLPVVDRTEDLREAYTYLSYYYYIQFLEMKVQTAKVPAVDNITKLLEIDPTNRTGIQLKAYFDQL